MSKAYHPTMTIQEACRLLCQAEAFENSGDPELIEPARDKYEQAAILFDLVSARIREHRKKVKVK